MGRFLMQWHLTHRCNLRCSHCYQEDYAADGDPEMLMDILEQFRRFCESRGDRGHINFTGGEPMLCPSLFPLMEKCEEYGIRFGLLTNGTLLTEEAVARLASFSGLAFVQVSIDGTRKTHDAIRGQGSFDKTLAACDLMKRHGIQTMVSFTAHAGNYRELGRVIRTLCRRGIDRVWTDRMVPIDPEKPIGAAQALNQEQFQSYTRTLAVNRALARMNPFWKTEVHAHRALQYCYDNPYQVYQCTAGIRGLTVLADGTLLPCRRLPIPIGNLRDTPMEELYAHSDLIRQLRNADVPENCRHCPKAIYCRGGAKCMSYAINRDFLSKDPNCIQ